MSEYSLIRGYIYSLVYVVSTLKAEATNMTNHLVDGKTNEKLLKTMNKYGIYILSFNLPAGLTCPYKGLCERDCYGKKGNFVYRSNLAKYKGNYELSQSDGFVDVINDELSQYNYVKKLVVRIHVIGDFYSAQYLDKWVKIARMNKDVSFYAYTKSVKMVKDYKAKFGMPDNLTIAYSYGGKQDALIDPINDKHSIVIAPDSEIPIGYVDGSADDYQVILSKNIALKYHGARSWDKSGFKNVILPI